MPKSRLDEAKPKIVALFSAVDTRIYRKADIDSLFNQQRLDWQLGTTTKVSQFLDFMLARTELREERIEFAYRPITRFTWGKVDELEIIQSINEKGYFSHYTAIQIHGLTEQLPKAVYFNQEQPAEGGGSGLTQAGINLAFRGKGRVTSNKAPFRGKQVYILNGKNTGQLGVVTVPSRETGRLRSTNLERTLIDATVRPVYAGGVFEVAKAFILAKEKVSVNKLVATLKQLKYTYPYHQSIGFYLERSGMYSGAQLDHLRKIPIEYDFFLDYGMKDPDYNKEWRLFVPKGM